MTLTNLSQKRTVILFVFTFILFVNGFSQTDFRPGYYITWENDTIYGLVDYRGEIRNSRFCEYKKDKNSESERFAPEEIKAYKFLNDKYYISKVIDYNDEKTPVFLEILVDGISNLYFMRTLENEMYFIEKLDGSIYKLKKDISTSVSPNGRTVIKEYKRYVGLLKLAFADCPEIQPLINSAVLSHQSLINLSEKYHDYMCDDEKCIVYEKKLPAVKFQISPIIGYGITTMNISDGFYSKFEYDSSSSPTFGVHLNTTLPRTNDKISFEAEVVFKSESFYGIYNQYYELYVNSNKIQPSVGIKYNFPKGKIRPTIAAGGFGAYLLNTNTKTIVTVNNVETVKENDVYVPLIHSYYGLYIQLGCNYHIFKNREAFTNLKIMHGAGIYDSVQENMNIKNTFNSIYLNIGFYLGKRG